MNLNPMLVEMLRNAAIGFILFGGIVYLVMFRLSGGGGRR